MFLTHTKHSTGSAASIFREAELLLRSDYVALRMCAKVWGRGGKTLSFNEEVEWELETAGAEGPDVPSLA